MEAAEGITEDTSREWEIQRRPQADPKAEWSRYALFTSGETHMDIRSALEFYRGSTDEYGEYTWRAVEVVTRVQRIVRGW